MEICEPGVAPAKYNPASIKGSDLHKQVLTVTSRNYRRGFDSFVNYFLKRGLKLFDKYHFLKIKFIISQPYFPLRLINFIIFLIERKRTSRVHHLPFYIIMDVCTLCNLSCLGCPTGLRDPSARKPGRATLEKMKWVIDQTAKKSLQITLFNNGEPLLNEDFYPACAYAVEKGLWTAIHSNLNIKDESLAQKIIDSKLHNLTVSCDAATQEVYQMYRKGGNLKLVFENIQRISEEKKKRNVAFPWIVAKFLIFDHNWHEATLFKEKALAAGADEVMFSQAFMGGMPKTKKPASGKTFDLRQLKWVETQAQSCNFIWETLIIDYDGCIYPCCICFRDDDLFVGPQSDDNMTLMEQWNVDKFRTVRNFLIGKSELNAEQLPPPCNSRRPHLPCFAISSKFCFRFSA